MKAIELYQRLEKDFIVPELSDDWVSEMSAVSDFTTDNFKKRSMGLVCDFAIEIKKVYTAVFPSDAVMQKILDADASDSMLFVHHPSIWDIRKAPNVFQSMDRELLQQFKERHISIYNLHVPLDNYGDYSTSVTLVRALDMEIVESFAPYFGAMAGVIGKTDCATVHELREKFRQAVGHDVAMYDYGDDKIIDGKVAIVAGGGLDEEISEVAKRNINLFVTGITAKNNYSKSAHAIAEKNKINLLGGTHYSTEKFACISMSEYFKKLGLESEFIGDEPVMEDM